MTERVTFLNDSGVAYSADLDAAILQALRAGYPMKGWPYPWREIAPRIPENAVEAL